MPAPPERHEELPEMMPGIPFLISAIYLTFLVAFVVSLLESGFGGTLLKKTFRRWGKFLLLLVVLAITIQLLTVVQAALV